MVQGKVVCSFLMLSLFFLVVVGKDIPERKWDESRAVKLADKLLKTRIKSPFYMCGGDAGIGGNELMQPKHSLNTQNLDTSSTTPETPASSTTTTPPTGSTTTPGSRRRKRDDNDDTLSTTSSTTSPITPGSDSPDSTTPTGVSSSTDGAVPSGPCVSSGDPCADATIAIDEYKVAHNKSKPIVISDLTNALMKNENGSECICAEEGAAIEETEGIKICIKPKGSVGKGKECIHHLECAAELSCVFDAEISKTGDIEDIRRFCSGSANLLPIMTIILASLLLSATSNYK